MTTPSFEVRAQYEFTRQQMSIARLIDQTEGNAAPFAGHLYDKQYDQDSAQRIEKALEMLLVKTKAEEENLSVQDLAPHFSSRLPSPSRQENIRVTCALSKSASSAERDEEPASISYSSSDDESYKEAGSLSEEDEESYVNVSDSESKETSKEQSEKSPEAPTPISSQHTPEKSQARVKSKGTRWFSPKEQVRLKDNFIRLRKYNNITQQTASILIGCDETIIRRIEGGCCKRTDYFETILKTFDISENVLLGKQSNLEAILLSENPPKIVAVPNIKAKIYRDQKVLKSSWPIIAKNVVALRKHNDDMTQFRLATLCKKPSQCLRSVSGAIDRIENQIYIGLHLAQKIATVFELTFDDLKDATLIQRIESGKIPKIDFRTDFMKLKDVYKEGQSYRETVSQNFSYLRKQKGEIIADVVKATGITKSVLGKHERGERCSSEVAKTLAKHYDISFERFTTINLREEAAAAAKEPTDHTVSERECT